MTNPNNNINNKYC